MFFAGSLGTPIKVENGSGLMIATDAVEVQRATTTYDHLSRLIMFQKQGTHTKKFEKICVKPNFDLNCKMTLDLAEKSVAKHLLTEMFQWFPLKSSVNCIVK